jgi:hypothetical protein
MTIITYDAVDDLKSAICSQWDATCVGGCKPDISLVWDKKVTGLGSGNQKGMIIIEPQGESIRPFALHGDSYWHELLIKIDIRSYKTGGPTRHNQIVKEVTRIIQNIIRRDTQGFLQVAFAKSETRNQDYRNMFRHLIDLKYSDANSHTFV